jgi:tetrapyrrole methylase family protein/MazG family protein
LSLTVYLKEEMYELVDAIESGDPDAVCEELGDLLFHILFIAQIFAETNTFDIKDVAKLIIEKMVRRHPHVFKDKKSCSVDEIRGNWHKIKMKEKNHAKKESILDSVPVALPALMRSYRISERAAKTGFDWDDISDVKKKCKEEWDELNDELKTGNKDKISMEFGDLLFTLVNLARFAGVHPERSLAGSVKKFEKRFKHMEKNVSDNGQDLKQASMAQLNLLWEDAKKETDAI